VPSRHWPIPGFRDGRAGRGADLDRGQAAAGQLRDRALLLAGFAGALRRSELVALDREHLRFTPDGMTLRIARSKRDQEGKEADLGLPRGLNPLSCPVRAMEAWLRRARIDYGPVFRRVTAAGTLEGRLSGQGVWKILRRRAALASTLLAGLELARDGTLALHQDHAFGAIRLTPSPGEAPRLPAPTPRAYRTKPRRRSD
jgi:integrase